MRELRQSTSIDLPIGPFVDSAGAPLTALTITQPDIRLKKGSGAWAQKNAAQTLTHEENGMYEVTLDATDTNTLGPMTLVCPESGALIVAHDFMVVTAEWYDAKYGDTWLRTHPGNFNAATGTFYKKDGSTSQFTETVGTTPGADPVTSLT